MNTLKDVKSSIRSAVGDEPGEWTTDIYLLPKIQTVYRLQMTLLKQMSGQNLERVVEIPDALDANGNSTSVGRTSLAAYQQPGGPLYGLYTPLRVWWKKAGAPAKFYREVSRVETVAPYNSAPVAWDIFGSAAAWSWTGGIINISPILIPNDILVDGRFNPPELVKDEDVLVVHPDMETAVVPGVLQVMGAYDTGNTPWVQNGGAAADLALEAIANLLITEKQSRVARAGTNAWKLGMRGWFWA